MASVQAYSYLLNHLDFILDKVLISINYIIYRELLQAISFLLE